MPIAWHAPTLHWVLNRYQLSYYNFLLLALEFNCIIHCQSTQELLFFFFSTVLWHEHSILSNKGGEEEREIDSNDLNSWLSSTMNQVYNLG